MPRHHGVCEFFNVCLFLCSTVRVAGTARAGKNDDSTMTQTVIRSKTRPRPTYKTSSDQEESSHDADSNPSFDSVPQDELEDKLGPWVNYIVRATHKADNLVTANGITSRILRQSRIYWEKARTIAKHNSTWNSSGINKADRCIGSKEDQQRDGETTSMYTYNQPAFTEDNILTNDTT